MGPANERVSAPHLSGGLAAGVHNDFRNQRIRLRFAISPKTNPPNLNVQQRFNPHVALINVKSFKRSGEPGQVGG